MVRQWAANVAAKAEAVRQMETKFNGWSAWCMVWQVTMTLSQKCYVLFYHAFV